MATLKTQGFNVSALPRSPTIPRNIGMVDVKAIDEGVRRGLATFEAIRQAPRSMILADAQMDAATAQAPLRTRGLLAETNALEEQFPFKTQILAAEASPEMIEAKRQALINRSTKQPSGDVQLAMALAAAEMRLAEDPNDAQAAQLVATLKPIALKKSATAAFDQNAPIQARRDIATETNQARRDIAAETNATRAATTDATLASREAIDAENRALKQVIAEKGFVNAQDVARINSEGRVNAARAAFTGKIYETAAQKNEKVNEELAALKVLDVKAKAYMDSFLGAGVVTGSAPVVALRSIFGDDTGKELAAATALSMRSAVETMRGLGAMSEKEFDAAMSQLPKTNEPPGAIKTKLDYLNVVRPWIAARNTMFLERLEAGDSPMRAHEAVRRALPLIGPDGSIVDPVSLTSPAQPVSATTSATAPSTTAPQQPPTVSSQEQYNALPVGSQYRDSQGNLRVKGGGG